MRDPIALTVSAPRFLTLGDSARIELAVHNIEGAAAAYRMSATREPTAETTTPLALVQRDVTLQTGERRREAFDLSPVEVGRQTVAVRIIGPGGVDVTRRLSFDVKPPAGDIRRVTVAKLGAGGGKLSLGRDLLTDLIPGRTRVSLQVGPMSRLDVAGQLEQLDRYPHGCAEQTVSRALPLVYLNDVARRIGLAADADVRERVQKAIERVFDMQDASGAFGIWGPADGDLWLTSYVTDFLLRAKETGYAVTPAKLQQALERLQNFVATSPDFSKGGEARAYALYVLARSGRAPLGELRYDVDTRLERFATPLAQAQLGAALVMAGDKPRAEKAFGAAIAALGGSGRDVSRRDYGSSLRDGAALVTLASETGLARETLPRLIDVIVKASQGKTYTSTQEQAWMVLAARALADQADDLALTVDGRPTKGQLLRTFTPLELAGRTFDVTNASDAATDAVITVIGAALTPEPAIERGFKITRSYYTLDGKAVDLASAAGGSATIAQNERLVAVLKIEAPDKGGRVILVDRLPAGLEIENPRLVDSGDVKSLAWLKTTVTPEHTDFRDDRFVAAFNFFGNQGRRNRRDGDGEADDSDNAAGGPASGATVAYMVRAVTPGTFVHPPATVEDMYQPDRFARTAAGRLVVTARE